MAGSPEQNQTDAAEEEKSGKKKNEPRRARRLSFYFSTLPAIAVTLGCVIIGAFAFREIAANKIRDARALLYLQAERRATVIGDDIRMVFEAHRAQAIKPAYTLTRQGKEFKLPDGAIGPKIKQSDARFAFKYKSLMRIDGVVYVLLEVDENTLDLVEVNPHTWLPKDMAADGGRAYLVNHNGKILAATESGIGRAAINTRPIVQTFIRMPLNDAQIRRTMADNEGRFEDLISYFSVVPGTNMALFVESPVNRIYAEILFVLRRFLIAAAIVVLLTVILILIKISPVTRSVTELLHHAQSVANGNFNVKVQRKGFGELRLLSESFEKMAHNLTERDRALSILISEREQQAVANQELEVAQQIQSNFLPDRPVGDEADSFDYRYQPATMVAGDWLGHAGTATSRREIFAIADVSGHGAGSSMFTSILAAHFYESVRERSEFDPHEFFQRVERSLLKLGKRAWHATAQVMIVDRNEQRIEFFNAGHPFPIVTANGKTIRVKMPSTPLGFGDYKEPKTSQLKLVDGMKILLYTDGILEANNPVGRLFGEKRLVKAVQHEAEELPSDVIRGVLNKWNDFREGVPPDDDICIAAINIAS